MDIGIITLSASDNCGSLLQAYALKKLLEKYGNVEIINFSSDSSHLTYDIFPRGIRVRDSLKRIIKIKSLIKNKKTYNRFRKQYLGIRGKEYFAKDLKDIANKYDIVVTGSDQVWNVVMEDFDKAFFLGWSTSKKIAYAPSLGGRNLNLSPDFFQIKEWLDDFSQISVREVVGKKCLEEVTGKGIVKVLDPTLVLDEDDWSSLVGESIVKGDYVFYYSWAYCEDSTSNIVSMDAKKLGIPVYVIDPRKWVERDASKWGFTICKESGPLAFLNLMFYAKKCFVESFHGMIFAYLFRKDFWLLDISKEVNELDVRLKELVDLFNAEDRVVTEYNLQEKNLEKKFIYFYNEKLEKQRQTSREFLEKGIIT